MKIMDVPLMSVAVGARDLRAVMQGAWELVQVS
jgi:hypothetical protein